MKSASCLWLLLVVCATSARVLAHEPKTATPMLLRRDDGQWRIVHVHWSS